MQAVMRWLMSSRVLRVATSQNEQQAPQAESSSAQPVDDQSFEVSASSSIAPVNLAKLAQQLVLVARSHLRIIAVLNRIHDLRLLPLEMSLGDHEHSVAWSLAAICSLAGRAGLSPAELCDEALVLSLLWCGKAANPF